MPTSSLRKQGPIRRSLSRGDRVWVPAFAGTTAGEAATYMIGIVTAVSCSGGHTFSKPNVAAIRLVVGLGVEGDAHLGVKVQHRSHVRKNPNPPNLRQVHLFHEELQQELRAAGFAVAPGVIGENVTTRGLDLL